MANLLRISRANARFQQWEALLGNRSRRHRSGEFLVQGVRPITLALDHGWTVRAILYDAERRMSRWAAGVLERAGGQRVAMSPDLLGRLSGKHAEATELVAVVALPEDDLTRIRVGPTFLGVVFDRPSVPGNVGTVVRSVDAFDGAGLIITGHGADPYDPRAVRASTGSLFAVPTVRVPSHREVVEWARRHHPDTRPLRIVGTDENADDELAELDLTSPTLLVVGNETAGLTAAWRNACDVVARIPIGGAASSLNVANAATVALYEAARQRRRPV